jgi:hypothetical protein
VVGICTNKNFVWTFVQSLLQMSAKEPCSQATQEDQTHAPVKFSFSTKKYSQHWVPPRLALSMSCVLTNDYYNYMFKVQRPMFFTYQTKLHSVSDFVTTWLGKTLQYMWLWYIWTYTCILLFQESTSFPGNSEFYNSSQKNNTHTYIGNDFLSTLFQFVKYSFPEYWNMTSYV